MGRRNRRLVAMTLGWELLDSPVYGNAHAEAWEICAKAHKGLQARATQSYEALNPKSWVGSRQGRATYGDLLQRVIGACCQHCPILEAPHTHGAGHYPTRSMRSNGGLR